MNRGGLRPGCCSGEKQCVTGSPGGGIGFPFSAPRAPKVRSVRVLTFTSLFPNTVQPDFGGFVARRMEAWAERYAERWAVVAPVPYFPRAPWKTKWDVFSRVPRVEQRGRWTVLHPRYFMVPGVGGFFQGDSMARGAVRAVERLWREEGPFGLIDAHFVYPDGYAAVKLGRRFGVPVVVSARGTDVNLYPDLRNIGGKVRWAVRNADACIGVCEALVGRMVELGADRRRVHVVPNGVDTERFFPIPREEARKMLGIPESGFVYLSVGALIERKGHDLLIQAFANPGVQDGARLYIAGAGPEEDALRRLAVQQGVGDRVVLLGHVKNASLPHWYNAADCFCLCSSREGWANVIMESLACGTPVVATNVWGAPEILTRPDIGILVDRTVESIANGLAQARSVGWDRGGIRKHVEGRTWGKVAEEVNSVFMGVLE